MILRLEQRGPHNPVGGSPARVPGSIRRTSTIDTGRTEGITGPATMRAEARDLFTDGEGGAVMVGTSSLGAVVDPFTRELRELTTTPPVPGLANLLGAAVAGGFRAKVAKAAPDLAETDSLLHLLLDDLPGAALVAGYAFPRADVVMGDGGRRRAPVVDLCAGWADGATLVSTIRETGQSPTPIGPVAPSLELEGDPEGWHPMADPGPHGTRRLRRTDLGPVRPDGLADVDVFFRDSYWSDEGEESVIHEYSVRAVIDPISRTVVDITAEADVLPWMECPAALGSASRVQGRTFTDLRRWVGREMTGTSTCTHLNDTLSSLTDLEVLVRRQEALVRR